VPNRLMVTSSPAAGTPVGFQLAPVFQLPLPVFHAFATSTPA
jgi:hypothetical protein